MVVKLSAFWALKKLSAPKNRASRSDICSSSLTTAVAKASACNFKNKVPRPMMGCATVNAAVVTRFGTFVVPIVFPVAEFTFLENQMRWASKSNRGPMVLKV